MTFDYATDFIRRAHRGGREVIDIRTTGDEIAAALTRLFRR